MGDDEISLGNPSEHWSGRANAEQTVHDKRGRVHPGGGAGILVARRRIRTGAKKKKKKDLTLAGL